MQMASNFEEERTRIVRDGGSKSEDTKNMVSQLLLSIERKVDEEQANRMRDLEATKESLEQKLIALVDKMKGDER